MKTTFFMLVLASIGMTACLRHAHVDAVTTTSVEVDTHHHHHHHHHH